MKDIYEMLNDIKPDESEMYEIPISQEDKDRIKQNIRKSIAKKTFTNKKKIAIAASLSFFLISGTIAIKPALASGIPIIGDLIKNNLISLNSEYANYVDVIGKTRSNEGIDVTFESAIADDNRLFLSFTVRNNNQEIKNNYIDAVLIPTSMKVNGKRVSTAAGATWEFLDNHTIKILKKIDWSDDKKKNKMNIDIDISEMFGKKADWGVKFALDKTRQVEKTVVKNINKEFIVDGKSGEILSATYSPLTVTIKGRGQSFDTSSDSLSSYLVLDDKGQALCWDGASGGVEEGKAPTWSENFISNPSSRSITIIPVYKTRSQSESDKLPPVKLDLQGKKPVLLPIDKDRSVVVKDYFIEDGYLVVTYANEYFGKESYRQLCDSRIYITVDGIELDFPNDEKASELQQKYNTRNQSVDIYKVGSSQNVMVGTYDGSRVKILKEYMTTVKIEE
jgi:hypothetical protein